MSTIWLSKNALLIRNQTDFSGRLTSLFASSIVLVISLYSIAKGFHFPNLWSYTHYLFPCYELTLKRVLLGCIVEKIPLSGMFSYEKFTALSLLVYALFLIILAKSAASLLQKKHVTFLFLILVFVSSPSLVFLSNICGYYDFFGFLIFALFFLSCNSECKLLLGVGCFLVSVFVHEAIVIIFYPVFISLLLLRWNGKISPRWLFVIFVSTLALLAVDYHVSNAKVAPENIVILHDLAQKKTDAIVPLDIFNIYSRNVADNRALTSNVFAIFFGDVSIGLNIYLKTILPSAILLLIYNVILLQKKFGLGLSLAISLTAFSPLVLMMYGYDWVRWGAWCIVNNFMLLCCMDSLGFSIQSRVAKLVFMITAFALLIYNETVKFPLLNGEWRPNPIGPIVEYVDSAIKQKRFIPPLTERWAVP